MTQKKKHVLIWSLETTFLQFQICLLPITSAPVIIILSFKITTSIPTYSIPTSLYDFTKADWSAINNHMFCINWQTAFTKCPDVPAQFDLWNDKLTEIILFFISVKTHWNNSGGGVNKSLFISENYYPKSAPPGEYINSLNPLPRMLGIKLLQLVTEKLCIHLNVTENWPWPTRVTLTPFIDTQILNLNLKLVWFLSLPHLVMLLQILSLKLSYLTNMFPLFFNNIPPSSQQLPVLSIDPVLQLQKLKLVCASWTQSQPAVRTVYLLYSLKAVNTHYPHL